MGYTHYWRRAKTFKKESYLKAIVDMVKVFNAVEAMGLSLAGPYGDGAVELSAKELAFNGVAKCGHKQADLGITWPSKAAGGVAVLAGGDAVSGQWFAGAQLETRTCGGDCSHETFRMDRVFCVTHQKPENGLYFDFTKTAYKPYDVAVTAALIVFKHHFGDKIMVTSDGEQQHWFDGMLLVHKTLGYGLGFKIDERAVS